MSLPLLALPCIEAKAGNVSREKEERRKVRAVEHERPLALVVLSSAGHFEFAVVLPGMQDRQVLRVIAEMSLTLDQLRSNVLTDHTFKLKRRGSEDVGLQDVEFETTDSLSERLEKLDEYFPSTSKNPRDPPGSRFFYVRFDRTEVNRLAPGQPHGGRLMDTIHSYFPEFARATLDALSSALQVVTNAHSRTEDTFADTVFPSIDVGDGKPRMPVDESVIRLVRA